MSVCVLVCLLFCLSVCLSVCVSLCVFLCLSNSTVRVFIHFLTFSLFQVDAMKLGVKEMKKEFKKVNLDEIEVCLS